LVGAASDDARIEAALEPLAGRVTRLGEVDDVTLSALYRGAGVLLYPSHREGFGLPVLEAMVHDTAVITSGGTATEEVSAGAALLVDPSDRPGIAEALDRVLVDDALRQDLVARGRARAGSMTWDRTGIGYGAIIDHLATGVGASRSTG
jgi:glycosyltransferase involved in cell wall biosynthesis